MKPRNYLAELDLFLGHNYSWILSVILRNCFITLLRNSLYIYFSEAKHKHLGAQVWVIFHPQPSLNSDIIYASSISEK